MTRHYTYIDDSGMEYFVYRLVGGGYGIYCARGRLKSFPYVNTLYRTAELAQEALNSIAHETGWGRK